MTHGELFAGGGGGAKRTLSPTKIEWCDCTWNPVWGCRNECAYCYARRTAKRWGLQVCGRDDFAPTWVQSNYEKKFPKRPSRIFVNSMSDVAFWEPVWASRVLYRIGLHPEHTFLMLTKTPGTYLPFHAWAPENLWFGMTVTNPEEGIWRFRDVHCSGKRFVSVEPIHHEFVPGDLERDWIDWVIVGAETGNRAGRIVPRREWMDAFLELQKPVFMKDSLIPIVGEEDMRREFPGGVV